MLRESRSLAWRRVRKGYGMASSGEEERQRRTMDTGVLTRGRVSLFAVCAFAFVLVCAYVLGACSTGDGAAQPQANGEKVLRVASTYSNEPYETMPGYEPQGFAVDLLKLMADDMGVRVEFLPASKSESGARDKVSAGDADVLLESDGENPGLKGDFDLTDAYIKVNSGLVMLKGTELSQFTDETGMVVGVCEASPWYGWAQRNMPNSTIVGYGSVTEAFTDLEAKNLDGAICDEPDARHRVKVTYADAYVADVMEQPMSYAFAVAQGDGDMWARLNTALAHVKESGAYDELYDSWFGEQSQRGEVEARTNEQGAPTFAKL